MPKVILIILVNTLITFSGLLLYDYLILTPKFSSYIPVTADIERLFSVGESQARSGEITLETYRARIRLAESLIGEYGMVINKNMRVGEDIRPVVFGGRDITDEILEQMESVQ